MSKEPDNFKSLLVLNARFFRRTFGPALRVISKYPFIVVYPIVGFVIAIAIILSAAFVFDKWIWQGWSEQDFFPILILRLPYFFFYIYSWSASIESIRYGLIGNAPDLKYGIEAANSRSGAIVGWAIGASFISSMVSDNTILGALWDILSPIIIVYLIFRFDKRIFYYKDY